MAIALPVNLIDGSASVASGVVCSENCGVVASESSQLLVAISCSDSVSISVGDASSSVAAIIAIDSIPVVADEIVQSVIDINTATLSVTDSLLINVSNESATPSVIVSVADSFLGFSDDVNNLQVFTGSSVNNISVSDSLRVRLNGIEPPAPTIPISVTDTLTIDLQELGTRTISVLTSDSLAVRGTDTASAPIVSVTAIDSMRAAVLEPSDWSRQTHATVLESVSVAETDIARIEGSFAFTVTDSLSIGLVESTSFGACTVGASDSCRLAISESLANSSSVAAVESLRITLTEVLSAFKDLTVTDSLAGQLTDTAAPIFDSFIDLSASDSCTVQVNESVTELVSFLRQLTASDSVVTGLSDTIAEQFASALASDQFAIQGDGAASIWYAPSVADSLKVGTTEAGLSIPIAPIGVSTFADDTIFGEIDGDASIEVVYEAIEKTATDSLSIQCSEDYILQPGYYSDDACLVGVGESSVKESVANATPDTWNGHTGTEHRNDKPKPWKYIFTDKLNW